MSAYFVLAVPVLPAIDVAASLAWWTSICGFKEDFRHGEPVTYAGISRGGARLHLSSITAPEMARTVGAQTMLRLGVHDIEAFYAEYQQRGGPVHPNGGLTVKPWGSKEFAAIDPGGVCISFFETE
jgi:uncharacterized glyoxalase superfamily protein PhnB